MFLKAKPKEPQPGTCWARPGMGATAGTLFDACARWFPKGPNGEENEGMRLARIMAGRAGEWGRRTNLSLTGQPLTAEDLRNIADARKMMERLGIEGG